MQRAFHPPADLESYHRPAHRIASVGCLQDRALPYSYHDTRFDHRPAYYSRQPSYGIVQEPDQGSTGTQPRRRIAVACARCRRRKIKCSGDPGDSSGCNACKTSGSDISKCVFNRVGSQTLDLQLMTPTTSTSATSTAPPISDADAIGSPAAHYEPATRQRVVDHRTSLPILHTRMSLSKDAPSHYYDSQYDCYGSAPTTNLRTQPSWALFTPQDQHRYYGSLPVTLPSRHDSFTSPLVEHHPAMYHYSTLSGLSDVAQESLSPMNMNALGASLPDQAPRERRLPIPYTTIPQTQATASMRADTSAVNFRPTGVHDSRALPWSYGRDQPRKASTAMTVTTQQPQIPVSSATIEPAFGYQFHSHAAYSPNVSPTSGPELADSFAGLSTNSEALNAQEKALVKSTMPTQTSSTTATSTVVRRQSSEIQELETGLYGFNTQRGNQLGIVHNDGSYSCGNDRYAAIPFHHPQQQHMSHEHHRRHHNYDCPQPQRPGSTHRLSSAANGRL